MKTCIPIDCENGGALSTIRNNQIPKSKHQRMFKHQSLKIGCSRFEASLELGAWNLDVSSSRAAFTLIELLVVIAIIAVLAALLLPAAGIMVKKENINRAISERDQLETAIEAYHSKYGFYPPGNGFVGVYTNNPLYYELIGTTMSVSGGGTTFTTLDGASTISQGVVTNTFDVGAFMNCTKGSNEDSVPAVQFLSGLKPSEIASNGVESMIVTAANSDPGYQPVPGFNSLTGRPANPWRYMCPGTNNPTSYDLWVAVEVGGITNVICNWVKQPQIRAIQ